MLEAAKARGMRAPAARALARQPEWGRMDGREPDVMLTRRPRDGWERAGCDALHGKSNGQRNRL